MGLSSAFVKAAPVKLGKKIWIRVAETRGEAI
jgi:hypothetical protein